MQIMVDTTDGFVIAEEDLKLRGPGDFEGTAQSGLPFNLKVANITKDADIMQQAREEASKIIHNHTTRTPQEIKTAYDHLLQLKNLTANYSHIS